MKHKLPILLVINLFLLITFGDVIKGDNITNKKKDIWKSRFTAGKGTPKKNENSIDKNKEKDKGKDKDIKKNKDDFLTSLINKEDMNDSRNIMLLREIYEKDNELSIIRRKKKKYKTATFTLGTLITIIALRAIADLAVKGISKLFEQEQSMIGKLIFDKWNINNMKKKNFLIEALE
ncbi:conserved Plasmodium protein, unknown function [Plasmodium knowlesi strain H]|uniref:CRA domain-containing protein n=3 Tax=Plasmodium knowlesi TaxID=5850 RepID=A0A5E7X4V6_PLAKH|nr:conserved Plasmodium protein, unknown function [Plasmodium knowlesi strain H]OTN67994.1 Uncharacterized protein PKNOH_S04340600 [Plasmodium knowlesi]CAA9990278.1 conserved Plasmodium protein, unknown function [Plasmodium knowlesi strain H]SBO26742.1 conserved Plasmodium protein, unknown function [Plasmodium knowlesi strain H]SBO28401.1 conserved Plasmodium protein, unknown function [Plasmodium knowlesi strain H]VVS79752.1 conserved Plasmodium protein, unknown function [Plasmodium knowlesi s